MTFESIKKSVNAIVANRQLKVLFQALNQLDLPDEIQNDLVLLQARWNQLLDESRRDILPPDDLMRQETKLNRDTLSWFDSLKDSVVIPLEIVTQLSQSALSIPPVSPALDQASLTIGHRIQHTGKGDIIVGNKIINK
jgi:hypothetical protein